ncbi:hypothetical protein L1887_11292 [Cichorium endivia]|nr:hypothetical protein L1887_11292 [Cichorium endivia]
MMWGWVAKRQLEKPKAKYKIDEVALGMSESIHLLFVSRVAFRVQPFDLSCISEIHSNAGLLYIRFVRILEICEIGDLGHLLFELRTNLLELKHGAEKTIN